MKDAGTAKAAGIAAMVLNERAPTAGARADSEKHDDTEERPEGAGGGGDSLDQILRIVARAPKRTPAPEPLRGMRWGSSGRYVVERRIGEGGMGTVFAATDTLLGRLVALKVLNRTANDDEDANGARVLREARLAAQVEHERIARVYDVDRHEGSMFVAMEFVRGNTLRSYMSSQELVVEDLVRIVLQIAEGLAELHQHGVIHRDLKPENVMLTEQGSVKLLDFGLARHHEAKPPDTDDEGPRSHHGAGNQSAAGFSGTPGYMAPERFEGRPLDPRVDVFALGVIVYELIAGRRPFTDVRWTDEAPVFSGSCWAQLPPPLLELTERMLSRTPDQRPADGAQVLRTMRRAIASLVSSAERTEPVAADAAEMRPETKGATPAARASESPGKGPRARSPRMFVLGAALVGTLLAIGSGTRMGRGRVATSSQAATRQSVDGPPLPPTEALPESTPHLPFRLPVPSQVENTEKREPPSIVSLSPVDAGKTGEAPRTRSPATATATLQSSVVVRHGHPLGSPWPAEAGPDTGESIDASAGASSVPMGRNGSPILF